MNNVSDLQVPASTLFISLACLHLTSVLNELLLSRHRSILVISTVQRDSSLTNTITYKNRNWNMINSIWQFKDVLKMRWGFGKLVRLMIRAKKFIYFMHCIRHRCSVLAALHLPLAWWNLLFSYVQFLYKSILFTGHMKYWWINWWTTVGNLKLWSSPGELNISERAQFNIIAQVSLPIL